MFQILIAALFAAGLFIGTLICLRAGWRLGRRRLAELGEAGHAGLGALEGSVYGLMGLLIAFTFNGAASRFQTRSELITRHVNAISTAWLRLDLLPAGERAGLQDEFRRYVDLWLEMSSSGGDLEGAEQRLARLAVVQNDIWTRLMAAVRANPTPVSLQLVPAVNEMFDLTEIRVLATRQHPPAAIYVMLALLVLVSALMLGFGMAKAESQSKLHVIGFSLIMALAVYLILDLEFPRLGLIRVDRFDQALIALRASMDPAAPAKLPE